MHKDNSSVNRTCIHFNKTNDVYIVPLKYVTYIYMLIQFSDFLVLNNKCLLFFTNNPIELYPWLLRCWLTLNMRHVLVRGLVVKTDGYSAEGPEFDSESVCWKFQYITRVIFTFPHTSLVPRPEFELEWVLRGLSWSKLSPMLTWRSIFWYLSGLSVSAEWPGGSLQVLRLPPP